MWKKFQELKESFDENKAARIILYIAALIMTFSNVMILMGAAHGRIRAWAMLLPSGLITFLMYYLSDGISVFMVMVSAISNIAAAFTAMLSSIFYFIPFFGKILARGIPILVKISFVFGGVIFFYAFPGLFVPSFHLIAWAAQLLLEDEDSDIKDEEEAEDVDYDEVYENVINKIDK